MFLTSAFALLSSLYPNNTGVVMVSRMQLACMQSLMFTYYTGFVRIVGGYRLCRWTCTWEWPIRGNETIKHLLGNLI